MATVASGADGKARALRLLSGEDGDVVEVSDSFICQEGQKLLDEVLIGSMLGSGLQGTVFSLYFNDGLPTGWVLKAITGHLWAQLMPAMAREWAIGRQLVKSLAPRQGNLDGQPAATDPLQGFVRTGAAVVIRHNCKVSFYGELLELLNGDCVSNVLSREAALMDILYIRRLLSEVFQSLAAAQEVTGFRHWDLRLSNIMEHRPQQEQAAITDEHRMATPPHQHDRTVANQTQCTDPRFAIIDFGHSQLGGRKLDAPECIRLPGIPFTEHCYRLFWVHRHDVFRLLMSLQNVIDGRCWPAQEREGVHQLQQLIRTVTGIKLKATFEIDQNTVTGVQSGVLRRLSIRYLAMTRFNHSGSDLIHEEQEDDRATILILWSSRLRSFWHFHNGNISAREALQMPFLLHSDSSS